MEFFNRSSNFDNVYLFFRQRELRHRTDGTTGGLSSDEEDSSLPTDGYPPKCYEDEEERQIQARLHKLVAMSRNEDERRSQERGTHAATSTSVNSRHSDRRSDYEAREKRYRPREESERDRHSSPPSRSHHRDREDDRSPNRNRSSRWDARKRRSPSDERRNRRLVDY